MPEPLTDSQPDAKPSKARPRKAWHRRWKYRILAVLVIASAITIGPWPADNSTYVDSDYQKVTLAALQARSLPTPELHPLAAGIAEIDISPPPGHRLAGFAEQTGGFERIRTHCYARALTLHSGPTTVTLLAADLLLINREMAHAVLQRCGLQSGDIYFTATHTHSGPGEWGDHPLEELACGNFDPAYFNTLADQLADVVLRSRRHCTPVEFALLEAQTEDRQRNRLDRDKPTHDALRALVFRPPANGAATTQPESPAPLAMLAVFSAHGTTCGLKAKDLDADYAGGLCERLRDAGGVALPMFAAGVVADHRPNAPWKEGLDKPDRAHLLGSELADQLLAALPAAKFRSQLEVVNSRVSVTLPALRVAVSSGWRISPISTRWIHDRHAEIHVLRLGDCVLVGMPGEITSELAFSLEEWGRERSLQIVPTDFNGEYVGYLSSRRQFEDYWAYETRILNFWGPWGGEYLVNIAEQAINQTRAD